MARRRKKTAKSMAQRSKLSSGNAFQLDKSLPAIPPPDARKTAYIPENQAAYADSYDDASPDVPSVGKTVGELQRDVDSRPSSSDQNQPRGK